MYGAWNSHVPLSFSHSGEEQQVVVKTATGLGAEFRE
jgi:hypothetical protein